MAFCRWGPDSDVYVYSCEGGYAVHTGEEDYYPSTARELLELLYKLESDHGLLIPREAFIRAKREAED